MRPADRLEVDRRLAHGGGVHVPAHDADLGPLLEPAQGQYNWAPADGLIRFATAHGQKVRGHTLVWLNQLPAWLTTGYRTALLSANPDVHGLLLTAPRLAGVPILVNLPAFGIVMARSDPDGLPLELYAR